MKTLSHETLVDLRAGVRQLLNFADKASADLAEQTKTAGELAARRRRHLAQASDLTEILRAYDPDTEYADVDADGLGSAELDTALRAVADRLAAIGLPAELPKKPHVGVRVYVEDAWTARSIMDKLEASGGVWHLDAPYVSGEKVWQHGRHYGTALDLDVSVWWPNKPVAAALEAPAEVDSDGDEQSGGAAS